VDVDLPGTAFLPTDYVPDMRLKIDLYRRLSRITDIDQLKEFHHELVDRFGPPPEPVRRMLSLEELRIDAAIWQIAQVYLEDRYIVFRYTNRARIEQLARRANGKLRVVDHESAYLKLPKEVTAPGALLETTKSVLRSS
jgi:transcription-repair coupling factor (superfamily II helicase)